MAHSRLGVYDGKIAGLYDLEETLGSGHFAVVKLARHVFTGEKVAVKVIDKTKLDEVSRAHLFQEVRCMKLVQHPNVVRLYEVIDTQTKLYLILELGDGGDLYDYIMKHDSGLSEQLAREYFRQIVKAISYCHQLHVVHRDLKPENVVFFEKLGVVKLTDFGFSNKFCPGQKLETSCGSLAYSAPEILLGDSYDAPAVDIWSLGVILYMLVCGQPPFQEANDSETLTMIMDCRYTMPEYISAGCKSLISTMLVREPEKRATLQLIAQHEWLNEDIISDHATPEYLPLISREQVSEEDHSLIIQRIINGNIATKDEILDALDRNEYNHITATYFLLAERKLRTYRQEQAQCKKPELAMAVSTAARISPRSRVQHAQFGSQLLLGMNNDIQSQSLIQPQTSHLNVPRTPGAEGVSTGRVRKCSIVQEEDDDEDECSGREDLSNRRGSRSEGRINITVQDRLAESDRLKMDNGIIPAMATRKIDGISGVKILTGENCDPKFRLGERKPNSIFMVRHNIPVIGSVILSGESNPRMEHRSYSIDNHHETVTASGTNTIPQTKVITDSATITIPVQLKGLLNEHGIGNDLHYMPKYRTMPSPAQSNPNVLNEIFEEGTDIGSSDSATTTPLPLTRHSPFRNARAQSPQDGSGLSTQRRAKFHKTRTVSCSSSDASDDDSENRKKRAHKIVDTVSKQFGYRRDSYDDSSDSQEPGSLTGAPAGSSEATIAANDKTTTDGTQKQDSKVESQAANSPSSSGGQTKKHQMGIRRNRAGRRKTGETRLRESQSLNRITEVQESDIALGLNANVPPPTAQAPLAESEITDSRVASPETVPTIECSSSNCTRQAATIKHLKPSSQNNDTNNKKSKKFTTRFLQGFKKSNKHLCQNEESESKNHLDLVLDVDFTKALQDPIRSSTTGASSTAATSATKKLKMIGKYFQVHKKICHIPIPKIFDRGRLYKAQSCGSIARDKINPHPGQISVLNEILFRDGTPTNCYGVNTDVNETLNLQKHLLEPTIGGEQRLMGSSEGDINSNCGQLNIVLTDSNNNTNVSLKNSLRRKSSAEPSEYHFLKIVPTSATNNVASVGERLIVSSMKTATTPILINNVPINGSGYADYVDGEDLTDVDEELIKKDDDSNRILQNVSQDSLLNVDCNKYKL